MRRRPALIAVALVLASLAAIGAAPPRAVHATPPGFVTRCGLHFCLGGTPVSFLGANAYLAPYEDDQSALRDMQTAAAAGFTYLQMPLDFMSGGPGLPAVSPEYAGVVGFQYWNPSTSCINNKPVDTSCQTFNDGPTGFQHIDWILFKAAQLGIHISFFFTQNSNDEEGGVDQYICWVNCTVGDQPCSAIVAEANNTPVLNVPLHYCSPIGPVGLHDDFYGNTAPAGVLTLEEQFYQGYVDHILNRVNKYTGVAYKDDPTIWAWDLDHEPGCSSPDAANYPTRVSCYTDGALVNWADTMSKHLRLTDANHLISVGTMGDSCHAAHPNPNPNLSVPAGCYTDSVKIAQLPNIDLYPYEVYPPCVPSDCTNNPLDHVHWIAQAVAAARSLTASSGALDQKPTYMAEFGHQGGPTDAARATDYQLMSQAFLDRGADGGDFWVLGSTPRLTTGWEVYCGLPTNPDTSCTELTSQSAVMASHHSPFTTLADPHFPNDPNDPSHGFSLTSSHSSDLTVNTDSTTNWMFDGDVWRIIPKSGTADSVVWNLNGMLSAWVSTHQDPAPGQPDPTFFSSPDGTNWTQLLNPKVQSLQRGFDHFTSPPTPIVGAWNLVDYLLTLPTGTNYLKLVFPASADVSSPQIGEVDMWTQAKS